MKSYKMKRILATLILILAVASGAYAQTLDGTWFATLSESESEDGADMQMTGQDFITFSGASFSRTMSILCTLKADPIDMVIRAKGSVSGTWKLSGNTLTLTPDKKAKPVFNIETENCPALIESMLIAPLKKELKHDLKGEDELDIISISESRIIVKDEDAGNLTYNKIK